MNTSVLLTLGRLPKALELARCLHAAGCRVFVADPFRWHLSKPSRAVTRSFRVTAPNDDQSAYLDELLQIIESEKIDLIVPVSEEALHVTLLEPRLPEHARLFSPSHDVLMPLHDKFAFLERARAAGLRSPETYRANDLRAEGLAAETDYVIKPALGCSGIGLHVCVQGAPLPMPLRARSMLVQKRIHGREASSLTLAEEGRILGTVIYEGLVFSGTVATCFKRVDDALSAEEWIANFVLDLGYSGFIAFDFILDENGDAWPLECNPRLTSGIHFMDHADLAASILGAPPGHGIRRKPGKAFQEGHTTLTQAYAAFFSPRAFLRRIGHVFSTKDVLWSWRDPLPFVLMTPLSWEILRQVVFKGATFGEAATRDIEWRVGEAANPQAKESPDLNALKQRTTLDEAALGR